MQPIEQAPTPTTWVHSIAHLAHSLHGFARGTLLDPRYLVFEPHAFRSAQPAEVFERALRIVAARRQVESASRRGPIESPLPPICCGAPSTSSDRGSCGYLLTTSHVRGRRYYLSGSCDRRHHATSAPQHLEHVVCEMVRIAFSESGLAQTVDRVVERSDAIRHDLRVLERTLARAEALYARTSRLELEAAEDENVRDFEHYRDARVRCQTERDHVRDAVLALRMELEGHRSADDVRLIIQEATGMARDLGALFDALKSDVSGTRQLLSTLTRTIRVRNLTEAFALVEIAFPHGARMSSVFVTEPFRSGHGERVYARARLAGGAAAEDVARELQALAPIMSTDSPHTADRVRSLAMANQWFEAVPPRHGPMERLSMLAKRLRVPLVDVQSAFVRGLLGPGAVSAQHEIMAIPAEEELRVAVLSYQRQRIAVRHHWPVDDTVFATELGAELGLPAHVAPAKYASGKVPRAVDEFGRVFSRRSLLEPRLRRIAARYHERHTARLTEIRRASLGAVGLPERLAKDFHFAGPLCRQFLARVGYPSRSLLDIAARRGDILMIRLVRQATAADGIGRANRLVYCPSAVFRTHDRAVVEHWMHGGYPLPTSSASRGSSTAKSAARRKGRRRAARPSA